MTITAPFQTKRDDGIPEWRLLYDRIATLDIGDIVTYDQLDAVLGRRFLTNRSPMYRALQELRSERQRSLEVVRGVGYRMLHPTEHRAQANGYRKRSRRQMSTAVDVARSTQVDMLAPQERGAMQALILTMQAACNAIDAIDARQRKTEAVLAHVVEKTEHQEQRVTRMAAALQAAGLLDVNE